jgi:hypothetical protein
LFTTMYHVIYAIIVFMEIIQCATAIRAAI